MRPRNPHRVRLVAIPPPRGAGMLLGARERSMPTKDTPQGLKSCENPAAAASPISAGISRYCADCTSHHALLNLHDETDRGLVKRSTDVPAAGAV